MRGCCPAGATVTLVIALATLPAIEAAEEPKVQMIFWEKQNWEPGGGSERLTLWLDGRSEILVKRPGTLHKPRPGWIAERQSSGACYRKNNPLTAAQTRERFIAALKAGLRELKTFATGYNDGSGIVVGVEVEGKLKETIVPMFLHPEEPNNQGSENHRRFLAVQKALGSFDTFAIDEPVGK